ncbi:hypothetical protein [Paraburkholderia sp. JHI869]|uniref:hypothetical protein n=1 Tax=Paraburkholderia sp. JHI869 TaxID=3112959 RepID=UPI00317FCB0A
MRKILTTMLFASLVAPAIELARDGHYTGGHGSSHKGGHYKNGRTGDHYERRG